MARPCGPPKLLEQQKDSDMHKEGSEIHIDDTDASGGTKTGRMRWVLGVGILLAIVLLSIIWITGALSQGDVEEEATVSGEIESTIGAERDGDQTDSIVSQDADEIETPVAE